VFTESEDFTRR